MSTHSALPTSVKVALRVRPLIGTELLSSDKTSVTHPLETQVAIKGKSFTFDYVFKPSMDTLEVYKKSVTPLKESFLRGYNCTILAYGQTGSGKTFTIGTSSIDTGNCHDNHPIIPLFISDVFDELGNFDEEDSSMSISYYEIYKNEIKDLLKPGRENLQIREIAAEYNETNKREIKVAGLSETNVNSLEEVMECLKAGSFNRTTGYTNMNAHSSRSHAIFTITLTKISCGDGLEEQLLTSKFHFVDLAGSERQKKTKTEGKRLKESIEINTGLLALGNVISALGDTQNRSLFVPFRNSKITRLLEDSLGGNSKTLMIACISPSEDNVYESLNTLKYANRARNIKNQPIINKDISSTNLETLQKRIRDLENFIRQNNLQNNSSENILIGGSSQCNEDCYSMAVECREAKENLDRFTAKLIESEKEKNILAIKYNRVIRNLGGTNCEDNDVFCGNDCCEMIGEYVKKITQLELQIQKSNKTDQPENIPLKKVPIYQKYLLANSSYDLERETIGLQKLANEIEKMVEIDDFEKLPSVFTSIEDNLEGKIFLNEKEYLSDTESDIDHNTAESQNVDADEEKENEIQRETMDTNENCVKGEEKEQTETNEDADIDTSEFVMKRRLLKKILLNISYDIHRKKILIEELMHCRKEMGKMKEIYENRIRELKLEVSKVQEERNAVLQKIKKQREEDMNFRRDKATIKTLEIDLKKTRKELQQKNELFLLSKKDERIRSLKLQIERFKKSKTALQREIRDESLKYQHQMGEINRKLKSEIRNKRKVDWKFQKLQLKYENQSKIMNAKLKEKNAARRNAKYKVRNSKTLNESFVAFYCDTIERELEKCLRSGAKNGVELDKSFFAKNSVSNVYLKDILLKYLNKFLELRRKELFGGEKECKESIPLKLLRYFREVFSAFLIFFVQTTMLSCM